MNVNEKYFDAAMEKLRQRREANSAAEQKRLKEVYEKIPQYPQLEKQLSDTSADIIRIMLGNKDDRQKLLKQIENDSLAIQHEQKFLLTQAGFPEDYLEPVYNCPLCKDKGIVNNQWCECFNRLMLAAAAEELNDVSPLKLSGFGSFDTGLYSDEKDSSFGTSPRDIMTKNLDFCLKYAHDFTPESDGIFMSGGTGLGKTHLSLAIADAVIKKGYSVIYCSAPEILRELEKQYYGRDDGNTMDSLTKCDLLILDDLGAELEKPVYTSLLYELINARISRGIPMIINSNCTANELKSRYQDRIWSRIFSYEVLMFVGQDVRRKLKK